MRVDYRAVVTYLRAAILLFFLTLRFTTACRAGVDPAPADYPLVTTLAGSGVPGVLDGSATEASFIAPEAIAIDRNGNVLVADPGGQRIRMIGPSGAVTTVAGSGSPVFFGLGVSGGYRDGPAIDAKFDAPSGIAVKDNGDIYVADTANNCIRRIAGGVVSTFAGKPGQSHPSDGTRARATFGSPRSLAFDARGNLYVADVAYGIRVIDAAGNVSTLSFEGSSETLALTTYHDKDNDLLFAGSAQAIFVYDLRSAKLFHKIGLAPTYAGPQRFEGHEFVGPVSAIAALGPREFVYTDDLYSTVRYVQFIPGAGRYVRDFMLQTPLDAQRVGGGFRDGPSLQAEFDQPMGVAVDGRGRTLVADAGNRRIRALAPFDRRGWPLDADRFPTEPDRGAFRIAIVGSSIVWSDVTWSQSIAGVIEDALGRDPSFIASGKRLELYPVRETGSALSAQLDFAGTYFTSGIVDVGVILFTAPTNRFSTRTLEAENAPSWTQAFTDRFKTISTDAATANSRIIAAYTPYHTEFSNEATYYQLAEPTIVDNEPRMLLNEDPARLEAYHNDVTRSLERAGVDLVDLWPSIAAYESLPDHRPILGSWDTHFTPQGCRLIGERIASRIIAEHPWVKPR